MDSEQKADLIRRLAAISPMPEDDKLTEELYHRHERLMQEIRPILDEDFIEPLLNSFGYGDANEGYWPVLHMLERLPLEMVHGALIQVMKTGASGPRKWGGHTCSDASAERQMCRYSRTL